MSLPIRHFSESSRGLSGTPTSWPSSCSLVVDRDRVLAKLDELEGYGRVDDELVFDTVRRRLGDFAAFKREILRFLGQSSSR